MTNTNPKRTYIELTERVEWYRPADKLPDEWAQVPVIWPDGGIDDAYYFEGEWFSGGVRQAAPLYWTEGLRGPVKQKEPERDAPAE